MRLFLGIHWHQANMTLKVVSGGTNRYTMAMCAQAVHEDAMLSFRDVTPDHILRLTAKVSELKRTVLGPV